MRIKPCNRGRGTNPMLGQGSSRREDERVLLEAISKYVIGKGAASIINFATIVLYTRLLDPESYGQYALIVAAVGLCNVILFRWMRAGLLRFLPRHADSPQMLLSTLAAAYLSLVAFTAVGAATLAWLWPAPATSMLIVLGAFLLCTQAWLGLNLEIARSRLLPFLYGLLSIASSALALSIGTLLILQGLGAYGPLLGLSIASFIAAVGLMGRQWGKIRLRRLYSRKLLQELLGYGLPLSATFALAFVVSTSDRFLIGWYLDASAVGAYAAGYDLAHMSLVVLMSMVNLASYPMVVRALEQQGQEAAQAQLQQGGLVLLAVAVPAAVGLAVCAPGIVSVVLGPAFRDTGVVVLPWIAFAALAAGLRAFYFDLAFQLGRRTIGQVWVMFAAAGINLVLNFWWIPTLGVMGAVYATVVAFVVALGLSWGLGRSAFPLPAFPAEALKPVLGTAIMAAALWQTRENLGLLNLVLQIVSGCAIYGAVLLASDFCGLARRSYAWLSKRVGVVA